MFIRKYWLPISVFIVAIAGIGLYLLAIQTPKEPTVIYKSVEPIEKPAAQVPVAKPPPPGETHETGHWHGDEWHTEPHEADAQVTTPEVQGTPVAATPIDAQIVVQAAQDGNIRLFDTRTPEYYEAVAAWKKWNKKFNELHVLDMKAGQMLIDALPTKEEAKQFENDEQFKKEMGRKVNEASKRIGEVTKMRRDHEAKKPPFPYIR